MHLALIISNGLIWDISLNEQLSPSRNKLIEVKNQSIAYGYTDDKGVLYILDGALNKPISMIHRVVSNKTLAHTKVNNFKHPSHHQYYLDGVHFGNYFWLFRKAHCSDIALNFGDWQDALGEY